MEQKQQTTAQKTELHNDDDDDGKEEMWRKIFQEKFYFFTVDGIASNCVQRNLHIMT